MAAARQLGFLKVHNFTQLPVQFGDPLCIIVPSFVPISKTITDIWPFFHLFAKRRPSPILDLLFTCFDQP